MLDKTKKIILAGGGGFIGKHLARALQARGYTDILVLDLFVTSSLEDFKQACPGIEYAVFDVRKHILSELDLTNTGAIVNLASPASPVLYQKDPSFTFSTNIDGTRALLVLAEAYKARFLQCSTSEIYGMIDGGAMSEYGTLSWCNTLGPRACYDEGKRAAETACYIARQQGQDVRIVRIFNTFGTGMNVDDGRIIPEFTKNLVLGKNPVVYNVNKMRCYTPVEFTVDALVKVLEEDNLKEIVFNVGSQVALSNFDMLKAIAEILEVTQWKYEEVLNDREDDPFWRYPDLYTICERFPDWKPAKIKDVLECLKETVLDIKSRVEKQYGRRED